MGLKGYSRVAGKCKGGIIKIAVADAGAVSEVVFDKASGSATAVKLSEGENFALYNFKEDSAAMTEVCETVAGFNLIRRELSFTLERLDENERASVAELLKNSYRGYIILTLNGCGTAHMLGYSRKLGNRFPMKVNSAKANTNFSPEQLSAETITFYNEDVEKAPVYTGAFP